MLTTNTIKIPQGIYWKGCAESWGLPLSNLLTSTLEMMDGFAGNAPSNYAQNNSKTNALNSVPFASDLTFRVDSDKVFTENRYLTSTGEPAYV
ncbi:MAG: hypothetical protein K2Q32_05205 [Alphaproteobacteria bacterium]|nr:hypothetical protein [Alphaproteobacteria bacterium]